MEAMSQMNTKKRLRSLFFNVLLICTLLITPGLAQASQIRQATHPARHRGQTHG